MKYPTLREHLGHQIQLKAEALKRVADLEHALKVCHADADRALLSGVRGDFQNALLAIRLTAGNAIARENHLQCLNIPQDQTHPKQI